MISTRHSAIAILDFRSSGVLAKKLLGHLIHNHKNINMKTLLLILLIIVVIIIAINGLDNHDGGGTPHSY
jgi:hypothetical protein